VIPVARCEYSCAYLLPHAHTRLRVHRASGIPHALFTERAKRSDKTRAKRAARMRTCVFLPGVSAEVLPGTCEHHHPDFLHDAVKGQIGIVICLFNFLARCSTCLDRLADFIRSQSAS
jgi:hypothetical protein